MVEDNIENENKQIIKKLRDMSLNLDDTPENVKMGLSAFIEEYIAPIINEHQKINDQLKLAKKCKLCEINGITSYDIYCRINDYFVYNEIDADINICNTCGEYIICNQCYHNIIDNSDIICNVCEYWCPICVKLDKESNKYFCENCLNSNSRCMGCNRVVDKNSKIICYWCGVSLCGSDKNEKCIYVVKNSNKFCKECVDIYPY
jgi:hypothetical protein